jgi:hypothetical protein
MHLISVEAVASTEKKALIIGHMPMINRAWMHIHIFFHKIDRGALHFVIIITMKGERDISIRT